MSLVDKYLGSYHSRESRKRVIIQMARSWGRTAFNSNIMMMERIWKKRTEILNKLRHKYESYN